MNRMESIPFLWELITEETPVLNFKNDSSFSDEQKYQVLGLSSGGKVREYISHMYYQNMKWYYFKKEEKNYGYSFYLLDELMGSYLAKSIALPAISFQIARVKGCIGLASENFREQNYDYYFMQQLPIGCIDKGRSFHPTTIDILKSLCANSINVQQFEKHILKLLALDLYMLQKDRGNVNLQYQISRTTKYFDLAPIYDFSNCVGKEDAASVTIPNPILSLNYHTITSLIKKYPLFSECLFHLLEQTMHKAWNQICEDFHFNQDCDAYKQAKDYYETKDQNQRQLLKEFLKNV